MGTNFSDFIKTRKQISQNIKAYKRKRSDTKKRLESEFIDHGIATIPCKVSGMDDIISNYSVPGYESLNSEFKEYVMGIADIIPDRYPIVLSIVGKKFSKKEQEIIKSTIEYDSAYELGAAENDDRHLFKMSIVMIVGAVILGLLIGWFYWWPDIPIEVLYILFWFFAYTLVEYIFIEGIDHRRNRIRSARLACVSVVFSEKYDDSDYSEDEAKDIFDELTANSETHESGEDTESI